MFINLCVHSYYSLLMSSLSVDDIIQFATKNDSKYVAICDLNNMYGAMEFYHKAIVAKLKPIIGLHIVYQNKPLFLFAKNYQGYLALVKISSLVMVNLTDPSVDLENVNLASQDEKIKEYLSNDLIAIVEDVKNIDLGINQNNVFSFNQNASHPIAVKIASYEKPEDLMVVKSLYAINKGLLLKDLDKFHEFDNQALVDSQSAKKIFSEESLNNLNKAIQQTDLVFAKVEKNHIFNFEKLSHKNASLLLQELCKNGLRRCFKWTNGKVPLNYAQRLKYELNVINDMGFANYFLIVSDYVNYAKSHGILVGPGRGSAAGSLVSYLLNITTIDPIQNNLIFERFLNPQRATMPDIDIDFMDSRRNEVVEYLYNRYGKDHVAHIITYQRIKTKMAIRDVGRILDISLPEVNRKSSIVVSDESLDPSQSSLIKKAFEDYPEWFKVASRIIDFPRQYGLHAAGMILSDENLDHLIPIQNSTDGVYCTQFSMEYLEELGLIKMDLLGLINLTSIDLILKRIEKECGKKIDLNSIELKDPKVFKYIAEGNTVGIFQLESRGMTSLVRRIRPVCIEDISICSALYRPGPQKNINVYLDNKAHPEKIHYLNNDVKQILSSTYNVLIYQEQIIQLVQKVAGFSLAEADLFRRAISKKKVDKLKELQESFVNGCIKQGYSQELANKLFNTIFEFANYGFNHSHSLAYSYISYWLAYLAYYYPLQFFTVMLSSFNPNSKDINDYLAQIKEIGIKVYQPDINQSNITFDSNQDGIIFGFDSIKGVGYNSALKLIDTRNNLKDHCFHSIMEAIKIISNNGSSGKSLLENLIYAGCFDNLAQKENRSRFWLINNLNTLFSNCNNIGIDGQMITAMHIDDTAPTDADIDKLNQKQVALIGVNFVADPIINIKSSYIGEWKISSAKQIAESTDSMDYYHCIVRINNICEITTKTGKKMCFISVGDETKTLSGICFPAVYAQYHVLLKKDQYVLLTVKNDTKKAGSVIVSNVREIGQYLKQS